MALSNLWAGRIHGTNTGNIFVKLEGEDPNLTGALHLSDPLYGLAVYSIKANFDGCRLFLEGSPKNKEEYPNLGNLEAQGYLKGHGEIEGEWATDIGSAGTFLMFPHGEEEILEEHSGPEQLHTVRHPFGAIAINRGKIITIAKMIQKEFGHAPVVITTVADTEQTKLLRDFEKVAPHRSRVSILKIFCQEKDRNGLNRIAQVEFGPNTNYAMVQGGDEAWALGVLEKLKREISSLERTYTTHFRRFGVGINQFLLVLAIIFLPGLEGLFDRSVLMGGVILIIFSVNWFHDRYLPFAVIYIDERPQTLISRIAPNALSWFVAATASLAATLLAAYLQGWS